MADEEITVSLVDAVKARYGSVDSTVYPEDAFLVGDKNRRRNKSWEMVGMEKTREKQSQHQKILTLGLSDANISIAQRCDSEIRDAQLLRVTELDLTGNTRLSLEQCNIIVTQLPEGLAVLQLSQIPRLFPPETITAPPPPAPLLHWNHLRKLILNGTGFVHLGQLQLLNLAALEELHLDNNNIATLIPPDGALAAGWLLPTVSALSLGGNKFTSLINSGIPEALKTIFPACTKLFLTGNEFTDLVAPGANADDEAAVVNRLFPTFKRLTLLCLNSNPNFSSPRNLELLRQLCPFLETFRITYQFMFPRISETQARMMVVASLPTITVLNRGTVRPKERLDSELFYVQRGLAESDETARQALYPFTQELREKHKDVVLSLAKEGETASSGAAHVMLSISLCCDGCQAASKVLPSSITVAKLKALVRTVFGIEPHNQVLGFWNSDQARVTAPTPLDNELQTLAYFGVGNGAVVRVQDMSVR
jgi:hypothetical protein